jgi:hypothetical protein
MAAQKHTYTINLSMKIQKKKPLEPLISYCHITKKNHKKHWTIRHHRENDNIDII